MHHAPVQVHLQIICVNDTINWALKMQKVQYCRFCIHRIMSSHTVTGFSIGYYIYNHILAVDSVELAGWDSTIGKAENGKWDWNKKSEQEQGVGTRTGNGNKNREWEQEQRVETRTESGN